MKKKISLSAEMRQDVHSFACVLTTLLLNVNSKDTSDLLPDFKRWVEQSKVFVKSLKIDKDFMAVVNVYLKEGDILSGHAEDLGRAIHAVREQIRSDTSILKSYISYLNDCVLSLAKDSLPAWNRISKNVVLLEVPKLMSKFSVDTSSVSRDKVLAAIKKIKPIVFKIAHRNEFYFLTPTEFNELKKFPKLQEHYSAAAKEITAAIKLEIKAFVRSKGQIRVPIDDVRAHLDKLGYINNLPKGFAGGLIDDSGKMYTSDGLLIAGTPQGTMVMNQKYDPSKNDTYVMYSLELGPKIRFRTSTTIHSNKKLRHNRIREFIESEGDHRKKWLADLNKANTKEQIYAAVVELIHNTSARIGSLGNKTDGERTFGLATLQVQHIKILPNKILFNYTGKKGAPQNATYLVNTPEAKKVHAIVKQCATGKRPTDTLFTFNGSLVRRQYIGKYLRSLGIDLNIHGFRNIAATKLAVQLTNAGLTKFKKGSVKQADVDRWVKQEFTKIGEVLHHRTGEKVTGMTSIKSYVDPYVLEDFYTKLGLHIPKFVPGHERD